MTSWTAAYPASLSFSISWSFSKLMSIELMMPSNHFILSHPLLLLPSVRVFPVSRLFASGGQTIGALASASLLPMSIQDWFPLGLTGLISLQSKGLSRVFSSTTIHYNITYSNIFLCYFYLWLSWNYCDNKTININFRTYMSGTLVITLLL